MRIHLVLFDIGNVVIRAEHDRTHRYLEERGVSRERTRRFYENDGYDEFSRGRITSGEFSSRLRRELKVDWSEQQLQEAHDIHMYDVDKDVLEILQAIRLPLAFATNTNLWQTRREQELVDLRPLSRRILRSHELHLLKKDPGAFEHIAVCLGVEPAAILFVDDMKPYCQLAREVGYMSIIFRSACQLRDQLLEKRVLR